MRIPSLLAVLAVAGAILAPPALAQKQELDPKIQKEIRKIVREEIRSALKEFQRGDAKQDRSVAKKQADAKKQKQAAAKKKRQAAAKKKAEAKKAAAAKKKVGTKKAAAAKKKAVAVKKAGTKAPGQLVWVTEGQGGKAKAKAPTPRAAVRVVSPIGKSTKVKSGKRVGIEVQSSPTIRIEAGKDGIYRVYKGKADGATNKPQVYVRSKKKDDGHEEHGGHEGHVKPELLEEIEVEIGEIDTIIDKLTEELEVELRGLEGLKGLKGLEGLKKLHALQLPGGEIHQFLLQGGDHDGKVLRGGLARTVISKDGKKVVDRVFGLEDGAHGLFAGRIVEQDPHEGHAAKSGCCCCCCCCKTNGKKAKSGCCEGDDEDGDHEDEDDDFDDFGSNKRIGGIVFDVEGKTDVGYHKVDGKGGVIFIQKKDGKPRVLQLMSGSGEPRVLHLESGENTTEILHDVLLHHAKDEGKNVKVDLSISKPAAGCCGEGEAKTEAKKVEVKKVLRRKIN